MQFKVGDKVIIVDEKAEGVITKIFSEYKIWVEIDGMDFPYPADKLMLAKEHDIGSVKDYIHPKIKHIVSPTKKNIKPSTNRAKQNYREVDLHIQELIDNHEGLMNGEIVQIQIDHFLSQLEKAISNHEKKVVFIHGVGQGVLKAEIRHILKSYAGIEFNDASYRLYGHGATEVTIHRSKFNF